MITLKDGIKDKRSWSAFKVLVIASLLVLMTGCATKVDSDISKQFYAAEIAIAYAKSDAIRSQSEALKASITNETSELERYLARKDIASLGVTESGLKTPMNGNDVATSGVQTIPKLVKYGVGGLIGYKLADGIGDALSQRATVVETGDGSTINITDVEKHNTALGDGSQSQSTEDNSSLPIVEEEESELNDELDVIEEE